MAEFEAECEARELPLFVLPVAPPPVERAGGRCNDRLRLEFWGLRAGDLTVWAVARALAEHQRRRNAQRTPRRA